MDSPSQPTKQVAHVFQGHPTYCCSRCTTTLALQDELISKSFSGREGRAFLLHSVVNVRIGKKEERQLLTGLHTVADIYCIGCDSNLGWTYLKAHESSQKYKEGKYIIETERIIKENAWSLDS
ncbi:hypothetical protein BOTBODRAFT_26141 [Botryobasidium botryosum FD-172 SS1]|uniref:Protein yippee-like n=1 Tax=Botryobasidium botryosum (strain FD-172 SS1) TaxID=930990 RepID=A0A067ND39_BOTB1|nr:hypothetical protein BOTBODRAFT_26141 [Botryobasidium botryosum FD-172 SS1]